MKKILLLLVFIFVARDLYAQTRQETLKWISDKINAYNYKDDDFFDCPSPELPNSTFLWNHKYTCDTAGEIFSTQTYSDGNISSVTTFTVDLRDLTNVEIQQDEKCNKSVIYLVFKPNAVSWRSKSDNKIGKANSIGLYLVWDFEDDLQNRMIKAFKHLIALQIPKETF